jgi:hypothetical protein
MMTTDDGEWSEQNKMKKNFLLSIIFVDQNNLDFIFKLIVLKNTTILTWRNLIVPHMKHMF